MTQIPDLYGEIYGETQDKPKRGKPTHPDVVEQSFPEGDIQAGPIRSAPVTPKIPPKTTAKPVAKSKPKQTSGPGEKREHTGSYCRIYTTGTNQVPQFDVQVCTDDHDFNLEKTIEQAQALALVCQNQNLGGID